MTGHYEQSIVENCEIIYLVDREREYYLQLSIQEVKKPFPGAPIEGTKFPVPQGAEILTAIAQALQQGGYIPKSAVDAELVATKYHLEDMRHLVHTVMKEDTTYTMSIGDKP